MTQADPSALPEGIRKSRAYRDLPSGQQASLRAIASLCKGMGDGSIEGEAGETAMIAAAKAQGISFMSVRRHVPRLRAAGLLITRPKTNQLFGGKKLGTYYTIPAEPIAQTEEDE